MCWASQSEQSHERLQRNTMDDVTLSPLHLGDIHGSLHLGEFPTEDDVFLLVLLTVIPGKVYGVTELLLLVVEVLPHPLLQDVDLLLVGGVGLHGQQQLKEADMLAVHLLVIDSKLRVPDVGLGHIVVGGQLVLVLEVGVLDVLGKLKTTS